MFTILLCTYVPPKLFNIYKICIEHNSIIDHQYMHIDFIVYIHII